MPAAQAARLMRDRRTHWRADGIDVVAADPEVPAAEAAFRRRSRRPASVPIEEIQPSRHRVTLPLGPGRRRAGRLRRHRQVHPPADPRRGERRRRGRPPRRAHRAGGVGEGFVRPAEPPDAALDRFYDLLLETGERRHFTFGPRAGFVALVAGRARGRPPRLSRGARRRAGGEPLAGLILYRHGGRLSTVHSGDHAAARTSHPGALHLLRWRAIQLAIREGCAEMDLGGVDVAGARGEPHEGDPLYGLYQHKRSFGGQWLELTGAHERVFDARGYRAGRLAGRGQPDARPMSAPTIAELLAAADPAEPAALGGLIERLAAEGRCAAPGAMAGRSARPASPPSRSVA